ncbi:MAG TPA: hypothetical protein VOA78_08695 [Candidatus Dormibacteraeota bacterium]|nr:hypothetical protein [Candidatus Dormibacteraeota bacterium]
MDHTEALRLQAAEKYLLGELDATLRDQYEEHYFDCAACALDLQAAAAFAATTRQVFQEDANAALAAAAAGHRAPASSTPDQPSWIQRFRWAFAAVPAFVALVLATIVTYQDTVLIPHLKNAATPAVSSLSAAVLDLPPTGTRSGADAPANASPFQVRPGEPFSVQFDFTPSAALPAYLCQLQDASGRTLLQVAVPADKANQRFSLAVPGSLLPASGNYRIVFLGADLASGQPLPGSNTQSFTITVAFRQ